MLSLSSRLRTASPIASVTPETKRVLVINFADYLKGRDFEQWYGANIVLFKNKASLVIHSEQLHEDSRQFLCPSAHAILGEIPDPTQQRTPTVVWRQNSSGINRNVSVNDKVIIITQKPRTSQQLWAKLANFIVRPDFDSTTGRHRLPQMNTLTPNPAGTLENIFQEALA